MKKRILTFLLVLSMCMGMMIPVSASTDTSSKTSIPENAVLFEGHHYLLLDSSLTWNEAKRYCESLGGHLVTINSQTEQDFVFSLISSGSKNNYWMGGCRGSDGSFYWITEEAFSYTNWDSDEPNDSAGATEDCLSMYRIADPYKSRSVAGCWNDAPDAGERNFYDLSQYGLVCEWGITTSFGSETSRWSTPEMEKAYEMNLIPDSLIGEDLKDPITRLEFAAVSVKVYENLTATKAIPSVVNPFVDCSDMEMLKAYNVGITNGTSDITFEPNRLLNREQAATMLTRVFKRVTIPGWTLASDANHPLSYKMPAPFADDAYISSWAKNSVYFMVSNGIINGMGNNTFAPKNITPEQEALEYANATREQALAIAVRMVENLG